MSKLIDLSQTIEVNMPTFPGDDKVELYQSKHLKVDKFNNFRLHTSMHTGTHIDSPMHLTERTEYICELPLESFMAEGCILDVRGQAVISMKTEYVDSVKENCCLLLYTGWDQYYGTPRYNQGLPVVDLDFCRFIISKKIKMLGVDLPTPDKFPFDMHKLLFNNNIYIIENLTNLDKLLEIEKFEVMALPLKIKADSSIARVAARIL